MLRRAGMTAAASAGLLMTLLTGCNPTQPWRSDLLSPNAAGTDGGDRDSTIPVFSPDGTKVAYESAASDLGPTDTNGVWDIYVRDLTTGTTTLVSTDATGTDSGNLTALASARSGTADVSGDDNTVAATSTVG